MNTKTTEKRVWARNALKGLEYYSTTKSRITSLTLDKKPDHKIDLIKCLDLLIPRLLNYSETSRFAKITYTLAMVNHQHLHILIKRPYCPLSYIKKNWEQILNYEFSQPYAKTLKNEKEDREKVVTYIMNQGEKHNTEDVIFITSPSWGIKLSKNQLLNDNMINIKRPEMNKHWNLSKMVYDTTTKTMREETERDRIKMKETEEKFKEQLKKDKIQTEWILKKQEIEQQKNIKSE